MKNKILIIEDDEFLRDMFSKILSEENFDISMASDGEEGLERARKEKPSLILLDLILPEIDGFEVLRRLKKEPDLSKIAVIILSNLGQKEDVEKGIKLGAVEYLIKAYFTPKEVVRKIRSFLPKK